MTTEGIYTSYQCNNDFIIAKVAELYFKPGFKICDVTYGPGAFWNQIGTKQYDFHPSDIMTVPDHPYDFRKLPYENEDFDVHVFDPPYAHNPGRINKTKFGPMPRVNSNYKNVETTKGLYHDDIIRLYREGMVEGYRVLKPNGLMLVKCQDEIESSKQKMSHIEIHNIAINLGMRVQDLFVVTQTRNPVIQHKNQKHARKNHSYLWIFLKA